MRPSTLIELAGFALLTWATYRWNQTAGIAVAGGCLLLIGYATSDDRAVIAVGRIVGPIKTRLARRKATRRAKKAG